MDVLLEVNEADWKAEVPLIREHFASFGDRVPAELNAAVDALEAKLG